MSVLFTKKSCDTICVLIPNRLIAFKVSGSGRQQSDQQQQLWLPGMNLISQTCESKV